MEQPRRNSSEKPPFSRILRLDRLGRTRPHLFDERPDVDERGALATYLDAQSVSKMQFEGQLSPVGDDGWRLAGRLGASVVQTCVATLAPVKTRIDEDVIRYYLPRRAPLETEVELGPEDDLEAEDLPSQLDLGQVALEVLSLALPSYPRAEGVEFAAVHAAPAGTADEDVTPPKPFADLAQLRDRMREDGE